MQHKENKTGHSCGSFYKWQLENNFFKRSLLYFIGSLLVFAGCRQHRMGGAYIKNAPKKSKSINAYYIKYDKTRMLFLCLAIFFTSCKRHTTGNYVRADKNKSEVSVITECPSGKQYTKKVKTQKKIIYEEKTPPKYRTK
ncbi:MAG: hypothetical protein K2X86_03100 [Cytophagaceae bacterium]|nr:hypothetical protein [Cytophagaceae bacterium]